MKKKNKLKNKVIIIFQLIFIIILIYSLVEIIIWYINNKENEKIEKEIDSAITIQDTNKNQKVEIENKYNIDFNTLKQTNSDTIAFLKVPGTNIESIVVKGIDNEYYMNHNFEKKNNKAGWIFADYKNKFDGTDKNIVVYGHNMRDGSMFGTLENILEEEWYNNEENKYIILITEDEYATYEVFSIYKIEKESYYINTEFLNGEFQEFVKKLKNRSIKNFNVEITEKDDIVTLSTCADNNKYRVVLHAKKVIKEI